MIQTIEEILEYKLTLAKKLDDVQEVAREAIRLATQSGTADNLVDLSAVVKAIDKVWQSNSEQIQELQGVIRNKQTCTDFPRQGMG